MAALTISWLPLIQSEVPKVTPPHASQTTYVETTQNDGIENDELPSYFADDRRSNDKSTSNIMSLRTPWRNGSESPPITTNLEARLLSMILSPDIIDILFDRVGVAAMCCKRKVTEN